MATGKAVLGRALSYGPIDIETEYQSTGLHLNVPGTQIGPIPDIAKEVVEYEQEIGELSMISVLALSLLVLEKVQVIDILDDGTNTGSIQEAMHMLRQVVHKGPHLSDRQILLPKLETVRFHGLRKYYPAGLCEVVALASLTSVQEVWVYDRRDPHHKMLVFDDFPKSRARKLSFPSCSTIADKTMHRLLGRFSQLQSVTWHEMAMEIPQRGSENLTPSEQSEARTVGYVDCFSLCVSLLVYHNQSLEELVIISAGCQKEVEVCVGDLWGFTRLRMLEIYDIALYEEDWGQRVTLPVSLQELQIRCTLSVETGADFSNEEIVANRLPNLRILRLQKFSKKGSGVDGCDDIVEDKLRRTCAGKKIDLAIATQEDLCEADRKTYAEWITYNNETYGDS